jgi:hypothetical protein
MVGERAEKRNSDCFEVRKGKKMSFKSALFELYM